ncbi:MAPEG family protein [Dokdonella sp. MW10]|uniref:MAPEG family protein n=1 Tax=Dokdonella sp. MW10 TaxID=2992926 RepID=UPI003F80635F
MRPELTWLAWSIVLGLVHVAATVAVKTHERGLGWNVGARDGTPPPPGRLAARLERAQANFLETFPFFAALVLAVVAADRADATTTLAAQVYVWARVAYLPLYAAGVPYLRTLVFGVSVWGLLQLLYPLL